MCLFLINRAWWYVIYLCLALREPTANCACWRVWQSSRKRWGWTESELPLERIGRLETFPCLVVNIIISIQYSIRRISEFPKRRLSTNRISDQSGAGFYHQWDPTSLLLILIRQHIQQQTIIPKVLAYGTLKSTRDQSRPHSAKWMCSRRSDSTDCCKLSHYKL